MSTDADRTVNEKSFQRCCAHLKVRTKLFEQPADGNRPGLQNLARKSQGEFKA